MGEEPATCKACGLNPLPPPEEAVHDPNGNGPNNPDAHIKVLHGSKGARFQCMEENKMTSIVHQDTGDALIKPGALVDKWEDDPIDPKEPNNSDPGGVDSESEPSPNPAQANMSAGMTASPEIQDVYDIDEEKDAIEILMETVKNPTYGLADQQLDEIREWADIQDGQLSPDTLKNILGNMSGVSKQMAKLVGQKYELKLNKWITEQQSGDQGPPIGVNSPMSFNRTNTPQMSPQPTPNRQQRTPTPSPSNSGMDNTSNNNSEPDDTPDRDFDDDDDESSGIRQERRKNRVERRHNAMNTMMEEAADEMANEIAKNFGGEVGQGFFRVRDIALRLLEEKAKRDPDKFFELAAKFDIDIFEFLAEPSEAKKNGGDGADSEWGNTQSAADREIDNAIESMVDDTTSPSENNSSQERASPVETNSGHNPPEDINKNKKKGEVTDVEAEMGDDFFDEVDDEGGEIMDDDDDDSFDEIMNSGD